MKFPSCETDISEFLQNAQVNRELMGTIELLQRKIADEKVVVEGEEAAAVGEEEISETDIEEEDATSEDSENNKPEDKAEHVVTQNKPDRKKRGDVDYAGAGAARKSHRDTRSESPSSPLHLRSKGF